MGNYFGKLFKVITFGESHGVALGCVIDGCPSKVKITPSIIQEFLNKRKPGQSQFTTSRDENDTCEILSGVENGITLGTPIAILIKNKNQKPADYDDINNVFRPSHADYTTFVKYGVTAKSGGGRSSARETVGRVAAAAVAKSFVKQNFANIEIISFVDRIYNIQAQVDTNKVTEQEVEESLIRCPDKQAEVLMKEKILAAKAEGDTLGGVVCCVIRNVPTGLGEPVFDKLEANFAKAMLSLPASKSFEIGSGLAGTYLTGSEHNDEFYLDAEKNIHTKTNHSGGIQGGISNGMPIVFKVGFKPVSTIFKKQNTITKQMEEINFTPQTGRHDSCVLPRAVPLVEAMAWLVLAEHILRRQKNHL
ncbi:MAG: chorismate synthase [Bdellovibrionota bacterium]